MAGVRAIGQKRTVDVGMQRFYAAIEEFFDAGDVTYGQDIDAAVAEVLGCAAGRNDCETEADQLLCKGQDPGFVRNTEEGKRLVFFRHRIGSNSLG